MTLYLVPKSCQKFAPGRTCDRKMASMHTKKIAAFVVLSLCLSTISVAVQANKIEAYTPLKLLGTSDLGSSRELGKGDVILKSQMTYAVMAVASADILGRDGKVMGNKRKILAKKGDELFGVFSRNGQITYCSVKNKSPGALEGVFVINRDKHTCFIDSDSDGLFDKSYDLRTKWTHGLPIYYDVEDSGNLIPTPVQYTSIEPKSSSVIMHLEAYISNIKKDGSRVTVGYRINSNLGSEYMARSDNVDPNVANTIQSFNGAEFSISAISGTRVRGTINKGFEEGLFVTGRPHVYYRGF